MQNVFILLIIIGCAILIGWRLFRNFRRTGRESCCGCSGCSNSVLPSSCPHGDKAGQKK